MKEDFTNIELIDKYLDGHMSATEKQAFESSMDASTKTAIENQMVVRKVVRGDKLLALKEQMIKDLATTAAPNSTSIWKALVLGSLVVTAVAGGGYYFWNKNSSEKKIQEDKNIGMVSPEEDASSEIFSNSENARAEETLQPAENVQQFENETTPNVSSNTKIEATIPTKQNSGKTSNTNDYAEPNAEQLAVTESEATLEANQTNNTCKNVAINALIVTIPSCAGEKNGKVIILDNSITGGTAPYSFAVDNDNYQADGVFSKITKGEHIVSIKDSKGCFIQKNKFVDVRKDACIDADGYAFFSPSNNETFNFPLRSDNSTVVVYNSNQKAVYTTTIKNKYHGSWDGILDNGNIASPGVYEFEVKTTADSIIKGYLIVQ